MGSTKKKYEEELDSSTDNKKKLHDELFQESSEKKKPKKAKKRKHTADVLDNSDYELNIAKKIKFESEGNLLNSDSLHENIKEEPSSDTVHAKLKKKKKHRERHSDNSGLDLNMSSDICLNVNIKEEPSPDIAHAKLKKKKKNKETQGDINGFDLDTNSDSYLNVNIKEEPSLDIAHAKPKKKKKHKEINGDTSGLDLDTTNNTLDTTNNYTIEEDIENEVTSAKKKKKRKRKLSTNSNNESDNNKNDSSIREKKKRKLNKSLEAVEDPSDDTFTVGNVHIDDVLDSSTLIERTENESKIVTSNTINSTPTKVKQSKRVSKISAIVQFEDENSLSTIHRDNCESIMLSDKVKIFMKSNPQLKSSNVRHSSNESEDEEQWVINCPPEVNIEDFNNIDLVLGKNKIKINEQPYTQHKDEATRYVSHIKYHSNKIIISNVPIVEAYTFCRRIPKPHISDDNIIKNNQTDFIPLPDTKCRHPFFGGNYKKSIEVSKKAAESLAEVNATPVIKTKKKKHKKEKTQVEEISEQEVSVDTVPEPEPSASKKKKKKHRSKEKPEHELSKVKLEKKAAITWESEKAIEENLFNF